MRSKVVEDSATSPRPGWSRRAFLARAALAAGTAAAGCASFRLARGARCSIPLTYDERGGLFVDATVDGMGGRFILDTGAANSTLSRAFAARIHAPMKHGQFIDGSAGSAASDRTTARLSIAGVPSSRIDFAVYDFGSYDSRCVGILGYELLRRAPFRLQYRERVLTWNTAPPGEALPMTLDRRIPRITVRIGERPIDLRIDSGATFPPGEDAYLNLTQRQASELGLAGPPLRVLHATGTGGAKLELPVHVLAEVRIGSRRIPRAFGIVQPEVGYFARPYAVGFLGNSVLDKLDPFFDYERGIFGVSAAGRG